MRIVVFTDLHPPLFVGGYEIGASLVCEELRRRGHDVLLLTAGELITQDANRFRRARNSRAVSPSFVDVGPCLLGSLPRFASRRPLRAFFRGISVLRTRRRYRQAIAAFRPERVLLFNPLGVVAPVLHDLVPLAREVGAEIHAYVSDGWLSEWPVANPLLRCLARLRNHRRGAFRLAGRILGAIAKWAGWPAELPRIDRLYFCSDYIRRLSLARAWGTKSQCVVPWGLAGVERLPPPPDDHFHGDAPLTFLYAGQIVEHKGLDVLLRAVAGCRRPHHLVVLGDDTTEYAAACKQRVVELELTPRVHFLGRRPQAEVLSVLGRLGHVLIVPSVWDEPFSIAMLEGMALGLPVVASATGGAPEAIRHGETSFLFERGQINELTAVLDQLEADRDLCRRVGTRARRHVLQHYTLERMVDELLGEEPHEIRKAA
jgi:glycosyltransferase involved in cell wall biosynthesis